MNEFVRAEWGRSQADLAAAAEAADKYPETAASRAYYAAFHAACAILGLEGKAYRRHSAVRAAVHRDLVQTGRWPVELGRDYDGLMESRDVADYGGVHRLSAETAHLAVARAGRILEFVRQSCPQLAAPSDTQ